MAEDDDYKEKFIEQIANNYNRMEAELGHEAYSVVMQSAKASTGHAVAHSDQVKAITGLIRIVALMGFLASIPVIVWLWKWALGF